MNLDNLDSILNQDDYDPLCELQNPFKEYILYWYFTLPAVKSNILSPHRSQLIPF